LVVGGAEIGDGCECPDGKGVLEFHTVINGWRNDTNVLIIENKDIGIHEGDVSFMGDF
jgi:hypothetical protein